MFSDADIYIWSLRHVRFQESGTYVCDLALHHLLKPMSNHHLLTH